MVFSGLQSRAVSVTDFMYLWALIVVCFVEQKRFVRCFKNISYYQENQVLTIFLIGHNFYTCSTINKGQLVCKKFDNSKLIHIDTIFNSNTMRQSRQLSTVSNSDKLKYPRCDKKKDHAKESLNFICLTPTCKQKGLLCVLCKSSGDHASHNIQPVRTFLTKLQQTLKKIELDRSIKMQQNASSSHINQRSVIQKLEDIHLEILSTLKLQIEEISQKIRSCQEQILKEYAKTKQRVCLEFEKQTLINKTLAEIQNYFAQPQKEATFDLKFSISKLLSLVKIQKNDISVFNDCEIQLNTYMLAAKTFKNNILVWERQTMNILGDIFKSKPEYQLKQTTNRPTTAVDSTSKTSPIAFSNQLKTDSVGLEKQGRIAKVKDDKNGKIVLLNQSVIDHKSSPIKFKVVSMFGNSLIQIGLCLKNQITQKGYKFQKNNLNHGLLVAGSNGFIYSSGDQQANNIKGSMTFKTGDELLVEVDSKENKLIFKKKSDSKVAEISLKHISQSDWKELYFCVGMGNLGDKVQLIT